MFKHVRLIDQSHRVRRPDVPPQRHYPSSTFPIRRPYGWARTQGGWSGQGGGQGDQDGAISLAQGCQTDETDEKRATLVRTLHLRVVRQAPLLAMSMIFRSGNKPGQICKRRTFSKYGIHLFERNTHGLWIYCMDASLLSHLPKLA